MKTWLLSMSLVTSVAGAQGGIAVEKDVAPLSSSVYQPGIDVIDYDFRIELPAMSSMRGRWSLSGEPRTGTA
jgi:hypothetical protein